MWGRLFIKFSLSQQSHDQLPDSLAQDNCEDSKEYQFVRMSDVAQLQDDF